MAEVYHAPQLTPSRNKLSYSNYTLFLAGSIDMGAATEWQKQVIDGLADKDIVIYNPRRNDWDSSWVQSPENAQFYQQVTWELDHMDKADIICYVFDPNGKAPITLLELGLHAADHNEWKEIVVCCPEGFWRRGNVQMICQRHNIPMVDSVDEVITYIRENFC
jgi:hypothetical protein